jgi:hypothetical protein
MRVDVFFLHHPGQHRHGTSKGIADEPVRFNVELHSSAIDHYLDVLDLGEAISSLLRSSLPPIQEGPLILNSRS